MVSPSPGQPGSRSGVEVRFGSLEISSESCELRKLGIRIRLQPLPFRILTALVENPGAVVTRDDLRRRLWPEDTFVDFERGLNTAVNRLRLALGDSAEQPRYIETVARTGYRFIAPVMPLHPLPKAATPEKTSPRPRHPGERAAPSWRAQPMAACIGNLSRGPLPIRVLDSRSCRRQSASRIQIS